MNDRETYTLRAGFEFILKYSFGESDSQRASLRSRKFRPPDRLKVAEKPAFIDPSTKLAITGSCYPWTIGGAEPWVSSTGHHHTRFCDASKVVGVAVDTGRRLQGVIDPNDDAGRQDPVKFKSFLYSEEDLFCFCSLTHQRQSCRIGTIQDNDAGQLLKALCIISTRWQLAATFDVATDVRSSSSTRVPTRVERRRNEPVDRDSRST